MEYFKNPSNNEVYGYDPADQQDLIDEAIANGWENVTGSWPPQPSPTDIQAQNKTEAVSRLQATDWAATVDITDQSFSDPYLGNQPAFLQYRSAVRKIAVNPPTTPVTEWPVEPAAIWEPAQVVL